MRLLGVSSDILNEPVRAIHKRAVGSFLYMAYLVSPLLGIIVIYLQIRNPFQGTEKGLTQPRGAGRGVREVGKGAGVFGWGWGLWLIGKVGNK